MLGPTAAPKKPTIRTSSQKTTTKPGEKTNKGIPNINVTKSFYFFNIYNEFSAGNN